MSSFLALWESTVQVYINTEFFILMTNFHWRPTFALKQFDNKHKALQSAHSVEVFMGPKCWTQLEVDQILLPCLYVTLY